LAWSVLSCILSPILPGGRNVGDKSPKAAEKKKKQKDVKKADTAKKK